MASFPNRERLGQADLFFKIILLGDAGTGKTSLMLKYTQSDLDEAGRYEHSLDTSSKIIHRDDMTIQLDIRDTAGMERYRSLTKSHYNGASGALVLFELTDEKSFSNVTHWLEDLKQYTDHPDRVQVLLVGTRCHMKDQRTVPGDRITKLAEHHGANVMEISVEENINVTETFDLLVDRILSARPELRGEGQPLFLPIPSDEHKELDFSCSQCCPIGARHRDSGSGGGGG
ncbi:ras-related protein Rab-3A-like [Lytechinus variegatus]|uniref:ras-related protein Rab-3A-like n=1 Tax=Lytechinus variegatus TaxID=7654 RepID=UPI001BB0F48B|nr:ras-related protein Rab-3A-like [Lytechinus variegatus]